MVEHRPLSQSAGMWRMLFASSIGRSPFTSYDWYQALCKNVLQRDPSVILVSCDEHPVALLPAEVQDSTLQMIQDERISDCTDILIEPGYEDMVIAALTSYVEDHDLDLDLFPLSPTSMIAERMPAFLDGSVLSDHEVCPFLSLPASWDGYLLTLPGKLRHELRRKMKRAANIQLHDLGGDRLGLFFELMARSDVKKQQFLTDNIRFFFNDIAASFERQGWLRMCYASLDNEPVAALFSFHLGARVFLYNSGYDPRYTSFAPGIVIIALDIQRAIQEGFVYYDFLRGQEDYKLRFGAQLQSTVRIVR
jgi:CelD/BcsL family acetyltransferase involved in cellulose biosynthesis